MFNTLMRLYDNGNGKLTKDMLKVAVAKPLEWITVEQYKTITGEEYA